MDASILVPIAPTQTEGGAAALALAADIARVRGGKITVLTIFEPIPGPIVWEVPADVVAGNREAAEKAVRETVAKVGDDIDVVFVDGHAAREILEHARKHKATMIVMASHDPVFADIVLGSVAAFVVRHAHCSVLVVRDHAS